MKAAAVLCICWRFTVQSVIFPAEKSQMPTPWARSPNVYERGSLLITPTLHAVFAKAENGWIFGREKNKTPNFEMYQVVDES